MSQIRPYVDEDAADRAVVDGLRKRGIDVLSVLEAGLASTTDEKQLDFATLQGQSVYTLNVEDFYRFHGVFLSEGKSTLALS